MWKLSKQSLNELAAQDLQKGTESLLTELLPALGDDMKNQCQSQLPSLQNKSGGNPPAKTYQGNLFERRAESGNPKAKKGWDGLFPAKSANTQKSLENSMVNTTTVETGTQKTEK